VQRFGTARLEPGGDLFAHNEDFLAWAARYDDAGPEQRSRFIHENWLATLPCPVLRLHGVASVDELARQVIAAAT
jgi:hypothetical protein